MSRVTDLLQSLDPRHAAQQAHRLSTLIESNRALGRRIRGLEEALAGVTQTLERLGQQQAKLSALQAAHLHDDAALSRIDSLVDLDHVAAHVRLATAAAATAGDRIWAAPGLWPAELLDLLLDTVPPAVLFEPAPGGGASMPLPPELAGVATVVLWDALLTAVVAPVLAPAVAARVAGATPEPAECRLIALTEPGTPLTVETGRPVAAACLVPLGPFEPDAEGCLSRGSTPDVHLPLLNTLIIVGRPAADDRLVVSPIDAAPPRYAFAFQLH